MRASKVSKLLLIGFVFYTTNSAIGEEFGNVFSNSKEIEAASRQASTEALNGVISILNGIRERESGSGNGINDTLRAADSFFNAGSQMGQILKEDAFPNIEINPDQRGALFIQLSLFGEFKELGISEVKDFRTLFLVFAEQTNRMGNMAKEATGVGENERMFARVSRHLQWYFAFANAVAAISESAK